MKGIRRFYILVAVHFNHIFQGYLAGIRGVHISHDCHCTNEATMKYRGKYMICINWDFISAKQNKANENRAHAIFDTLNYQMSSYPR